MAVTITAAELAAAIRLGDSAQETAEVTRLLATATAIVTKHAPDAPDAIQNEAVIRIAGYLYDAPGAASGAGYADAMRNSGAGSLLLPYRVHRAGTTKEAVSEAQAAVGTADNPVVDVTVSGSTLRVHFADGTTHDRKLPSTGGDGPGVDQTARNAAATAVAIAQRAEGKADSNTAALAGKADTADIAAAITAWAANLVPTSARGALIATSSTLPTAASNSDLTNTWTLAAGIPAGFERSGNLLTVPPLRASHDALGLWAVALVDGVEVAEVSIPWGGGGSTDDESSNEASNHQLALGAGDLIDVRYARFSGHYGVTLYGDGDVLPANSTVRIYLAVTGGLAGIGETTGIDQKARDAAAAAQRTADAAGTYTLPAAAPGVRGGVQAITNTIIDAGTSTGIFGWALSHIKRVAQAIANDAANAAVENGVQVPARAAPGNEIGGKQQYFGADFYAADAEHGQVFTAHRNGSPFWGDPNDIPAVVQVSPGVIDKNNIPDSFRVSVLTRNGFASTATKVHVELLGQTVEVAYDPAIREHNLRLQVNAALRTAIGAHTAAGAGSVTALTTTFRTAANVIVAGTQVINEMQVVAGPSGSAVSAGLTTAQQIALLALIREPAVIAFSTQDALEKAVKTVRLGIPNPELLTGDVWYEGEIQGQPALARAKWSSATAALILTVSESVAGNIATAVASDTELEVRLRFFDAANAGKEIERIGVNIPLVKIPAASGPVAPVLLATLTDTVDGTTADYNKVRAWMNANHGGVIRVEAEYPRTFGTITDGKGFAEFSFQVPAENLRAAGGSDDFYREYAGAWSDQSGRAEQAAMSMRPGGATKFKLNHQGLPAGYTVRVYGAA